MLLHAGTAADAESDGKETPPRPLTSYVGQFTIGGCLALCEAVSFCADVADFDVSNGDCTLQIDVRDQSFRRLADSCPPAREGRLRAEHADGRWQLLCPR